LHFEVENVPIVVADVVMVNANNNHDDHGEDNDGEGNIGRGPEEHMVRLMWLKGGWLN
jgi:hypothetical protein